MKRLTAIAAVFALGLIAPTTVGAAAKEYNGTFESSGTVDFKLKKSNKGKKKIIDFAFHGFPVHCDGGPNSTSGILKFKVKVEKNKFEADAQSTD
ncbi:MAG: hypothetical protein ACXWUV_14890, partial [Allosphingosinicella sp.]